MKELTICDEKECTRCGEFKPYNEFYRDKKSKDGWNYWCKKCHAEKNRLYRLANKEEIAEQKRLYYLANKEKRAEYARLRYLKNKKKKLLGGDKQW